MSRVRRTLGVLAIAATVSLGAALWARSSGTHLSVAWVALGAAAQDSLSPVMIARGDSIFRGQLAGGTCFTCHGQQARGMVGLGPDLTDTTWLNTDGTYSGIVEVISKGVPRPRKAIAPMLPMGGARLSQEQIRAAGAFVYSLRKGD